MTLKEFKKLLNGDKELQKKFEEAKASVKEMKDEAAAMSKICADLGFDVPASEFALDVIGCQELDDEELEAVAGGRGYHKIDEDLVVCDIASEATGFKRVANWGEEGCVYTYEENEICPINDICSSYSVIYPENEECHFDYYDKYCWTYDSCPGVQQKY